MRRNAAHIVMIALVDVFDHATLLITRMADWVAPARTPPEAMALIHGSHGLALSASTWLITWHVSLLCARLIRYLMTLYIDFHEEAVRRFDHFWASAWLRAVRKLNEWAIAELVSLSVEAKNKGRKKKSKIKKGESGVKIKIKKHSGNKNKESY